jgi:hypothetical protein
MKTHQEVQDFRWKESRLHNTEDFSGYSLKMHAWLFDWNVGKRVQELNFLDKYKNAKYRKSIQGH